MDGRQRRLRAGPQPDAAQDQKESTEDDTEADPELRLRGYKETFVREHDGIKVYHHQGRYQHVTVQFHYWAFYEYRMMINSESWNIITDEDMVKTPSSFPGSNSNKLTHDFCHLDSRYCDDVYTSFNFVDMAGRRIWSFYVSECFQEHLWICVSPRRFAIISSHLTNEKLNHFYSNKMHEHHILAFRTSCWSFDEVENDKGKVIERTIAPSEDTRLRSASHETFSTDFEDKHCKSLDGVTKTSPMFSPLFLLPYHVEMIQCYHLLHELAHELAPVTPWFCGFVLGCCVLFFVGGFVFGWCFVLFGGDFVTVYWTALRSYTSSFLRPLNQRTAMCMR